MKTKIEVEVTNIKVGKKYFSFNYNVSMKIGQNKTIVREGKYDSSHSRAPQTMRKHLNGDWGVRLALIQFFGM